MTAQYYLAQLAAQAEIDVLVNQDDFELALRELIPSVSEAELQHYAEVQAKFSNETINSLQPAQDAPDDALASAFLQATIESEMSRVNGKGKGKQRAT